MSFPLARQRLVAPSGLAPVLAVLLLACGADEADPGPGGGDLPGTMGRVQRVLRREVIAKVEAYEDAGRRLATAIVMGSADGVSLAGGFGSVELDLDGDGTFDEALQVSVQQDAGDPLGPVRIGVSEGGPGEALLSLGGTVVIDLANGIDVDMGFGMYEGDDVSIYADGGSGTLPMRPEAGTTLGSIAFDAFDPDYEDILAGELFFEVTGTRPGYRIRVVVSDDPKTPVDESFEFIVD